MRDIPKTWRVEPNVGLLIDDEVVPWPIAADPGPMVEPIDDHLHILWLPVAMDGPIPAYGRPDGEPVPEPTTPPRTHGGDNDSADGGAEGRQA